jgi:hypothetical protein
VLSPASGSSLHSRGTSLYFAISEAAIPSLRFCTNNDRTLSGSQENREEKKIIFEHVFCARPVHIQPRYKVEQSSML